MMTLSFPEWVPLWGQLLALAVGIVFGLAFMMMPFAVFGVKSRLSELSLQLEELQAELRARAMQGNGVSAGYATGAAEGPLPFVARRTDAPVVEEVRPPVAEKNQPPRSTPVFAELRAPRVSDAYEPRLDAPPAPHIEPDSYKAAPARRMPWHEEQPPEAESGAEILRRQRALMPIRLHTGLIFHTSSHPHALPCPKRVMTRIQVGLNLCCIFHPATGRKLLRGLSGFRPDLCWPGLYLLATCGLAQTMTRSSRWISSSRPCQPRMRAVSLDWWPAMRRASSAS
ncbi:hypothetical protein [Acetobacter okinawensis]|uniref:hypothetical protein n=1 Tax=Acetobacter okinawensis TaxID=1076594 RepID=UPI0004712DE3|nr:hypothetical protein [Acetobacter okinawensis]